MNHHLTIALCVMTTLVMAQTPLNACEAGHEKHQSTRTAVDGGELASRKPVITYTAEESAVKKPPTISIAISITKAWAKPNYGPNGAVYLTLTNNGAKAEKLLSAAAPLSKRVELHEHRHEDGVMRMRQVKEPLIIPAGKSLSFKPGGLHIMLFEMTEKKKTGESFPLTLMFEGGETLSLDVSISETAPE